jgi:ADP-ribose pyrophosphatase YjhB (NUDIX family)
MPFRCVIHGSFRRHFAEIRQAISAFEAAGIEVLAPTFEKAAGEKDGFVYFEGEEGQDPRYIELLYLSHLKKLGRDGFSYFVDPEGYIGRSASYELGIAHATNVPCFFLEKPADHPFYAPANAVWRPGDLASHIREQGALPKPEIRPDEWKIQKLYEELILPGSVVATGGIIEYDSGKKTDKKELLFVKTHKWGGRYSMVGGKVRRQETLQEALAREIKEETGLAVRAKEHICTFDQLKSSGYYQPWINHIFVDYIASVPSKKVALNDEAEDYAWVTVEEAEALDLEPNARHTLEQYRRYRSLSL